MGASLAMVSQQLKSVRHFTIAPSLSPIAASLSPGFIVGETAASKNLRRGRIRVTYARSALRIFSNAPNFRAPQSRPSCARRVGIAHSVCQEARRYRLPRRKGNSVRRPIPAANPLAQPRASVRGAVRRRARYAAGGGGGGFGGLGGGGFGGFGGNMGQSIPGYGRPGGGCDPTPNVTSPSLRSRCATTSFDHLVGAGEQRSRSRLVATASEDRLSFRRNSHTATEQSSRASSAKRQTWRGSRFGETCTSMPVGTARGEVQHLTDYYGFVIALTASECAICATSSDG